MNKEEKQFLENYDSTQFEKLSMTTDIVIISVSDKEQSDYRKTSDKKLSILLVKRTDFPYKGNWSLPGGFLDAKKERLEDCAIRVLENETNLKDIYMEQLYTFSEINRDPRTRVISSSYIALVDKNRIKEELNENAAWFDITVLEENNKVYINLSNDNDNISFEIEKKLKKYTKDRYEFKMLKNDNLAFDHPLAILAGLERLKNRINYTDIVFTMMPEYFTLGELQKVYETILGKKLLDPAFRRIITGKVEKTDKMKTGGGHRPSVMFKYKSK